MNIAVCALQQHLPLAVLKRNFLTNLWHHKKLQQHLPLAVLKLSFIFLFSNTGGSCNSTYRLRYWNLNKMPSSITTSLVATALTACGIETTGVSITTGSCFCCVATVLTACGMRRRVRGSRGAKWRWGPHISSPWPKGRGNKGDKATALTVYGIVTAQLWTN